MSSFRHQLSSSSLAAVLSALLSLSQSNNNTLHRQSALAFELYFVKNTSKNQIKICLYCKDQVDRLSIDTALELAVESRTMSVSCSSTPIDRRPYSRQWCHSISHTPISNRTPYTQCIQDRTLSLLYVHCERRDKIHKTFVYIYCFVVWNLSQINTTKTNLNKFTFISDGVVAIIVFSILSSNAEFKRRFRVVWKVEIDAQSVDFDDRCARRRSSRHPAQLISSCTFASDVFRTERRIDWRTARLTGVRVRNRIVAHAEIFRCRTVTVAQHFVVRQQRTVRRWIATRIARIVRIETDVAFPARSSLIAEEMRMHVQLYFLFLGFVMRFFLRVTKQETE